MHFILLFPLLSATLLPQTIANVIPVDDNLVAAVDNLQNLDEYDTIDHRISDNILQDGIEILKSIPPQPPRAEDTLSDLERQFAEPQGACKGFSGAIHVTCEGPEVDTDPPKSGVLAFVLNCNGGKRTNPPGENIVAEYCCEEFDQQSPDYAANVCRRLPGSTANIVRWSWAKYWQYYRKQPK